MVSFSGDGECDVLILFCSLDTYMSRGVLCFGEFCFASDYGMCFVCVKEAAVGSAFLRSTFYGFKKKIIKKYIHTKIQHRFEYILNNLKFKYQCSFKKAL